MNKRAVAIIVAFALLLAACGAPGSNATPTRDGVRPAPGGTVSGAEGTAEPDALTPTPTTPPATLTRAPTKTPRQHATASASVQEGDEGTYEVVVSIHVSKVGLSGVDVRGVVRGEGVAIYSIVASTGLGEDALVATEQVEDGGTAARVASARRGQSEPGDVEAEIARLTVSAPDINAVVDGMAIEVDFTDAGLTLYGPIVAAID